MLVGKRLTDFTSLFSPFNFKNNDDIIFRWMNECNSIEIDKTSFTDQTKYRLNEITKTENYFNSN